MKRKIVVFVLSALFLFSTHASAEVIKLKLANYFPPMHMNSALFDKYCADLNQKLAGKVEITQYKGGILLGPDKMATGVLSGITDIGFCPISYNRGRFPVMEIMEMPLGFPSSWISGHVANDFYNKFKPKELDKYKVLYLSMTPTNVVQTAKKPVRTLDDIKGLKLRANAVMGDIAKALGATPIPMPAGDMYEALRKGIIDGIYLNMETLKGFNTGEIIRYVTPPWHLGSGAVLITFMSKKKWGSLPPDVQKVISDYSTQFMERHTVEFNRIEIEGQQFFLSKGGKIIPLSNAEGAKWVKAVQPVIDDYKKSMVAKGYKAADIDKYISFIKERTIYWTKQEKARKIPSAYPHD